MRKYQAYLHCVLLLLLTASCRQQHASYRELRNGVLKHLAGTWQVDGEQTFERWYLEKDSTFAGQAYQYVNGQKIQRESLSIVEVDGQIYYEATVPDQNEGKPVRFRLAGFTGKNIVFINPGHDFPKRIEYEFVDPNHILATVGDAKGDLGKSFSINYLRVMKPKKVTGIGGIFFKCEDPGKMRDWYKDNLGLVTNEYGSLFEFRLSDKPEKKGYLQWSPFPAKTDYFEPSKKEFMINYRVENLEALVEELRKSGVVILDTIETYDYGKFIHILDPENNKIELWEPVDNEFTENYEGETTK